jgi:hypothetical protein
MSTKDLIEKYPEEFVGFLERKFRAKCMVWFVLQNNLILWKIIEFKLKEKIIIFNYFVKRYFINKAN